MNFRFLNYGILNDSAISQAGETLMFLVTYFLNMALLSM